MRNKYPVPLIQDLFDWLTKVAYFTKLDLHLGDQRVHIAEGDESKTTCVTRYGSTKFFVMPFGLINAPSTFSNLMNNVFHEYIVVFVIV